LREISPEFKLENDAGHHTNGEIDSEDPHPEPVHPVIDFLPRRQPQRFHHDQVEGEADREHREKDVEQGRYGKLKSGEKDDVHRGHILPKVHPNS